jgi:hypothetical protein
VVHFPHCFGWELRNLPLGVLATSPRAAAQALMWRQWSPDVIVFRHTAPGIRVVAGEVVGVDFSDGRLSGLRLQSGEVEPRRALVVAPRFAARHALLDHLDVAVAERHLRIGCQVEADATGRTAAPGLWVAGNVAEEAAAKAANLADLMRRGFPVPEGSVVIGEPDAESILEAATALGDVPLAVRSLAVAEDLADVSLAGQYETFLDIRGGPALLDAVRRRRESARTDRVGQYRRTLAGTTDDRIAVLIQRMLHPESAGVAFTASPVTGEREVVITAVRGLGEQVVAGEAVGDEWVVDATGPRCRRSVKGVIDLGRAREIAELAGRVEARFGVPQDTEWAIAGGRLHLLQARPMTAVPERVEWRPPSPGYWMRNFRLGEWLVEAMTPLFRDWLLELIEDGYLEGCVTPSGLACPSATPPSTAGTTPPRPVSPCSSARGAPSELGSRPALRVAPPGTDQQPPRACRPGDPPRARRRVAERAGPTLREAHRGGHGPRRNGVR